MAGIETKSQAHRVRIGLQPLAADPILLVVTMTVSYSRSETSICLLGTSKCSFQDEALSA